MTRKKNEIQRKWNFISLFLGRKCTRGWSIRQGGVALSRYTWGRFLPAITNKDAFQYEVLKMLKKEEKINDAIIENMLSWRHTGLEIMIHHH
jgi:hypothetical protein